jgi:hypothetical protein
MPRESGASSNHWSWRLGIDVQHTDFGGYWIVRFRGR